MWRTFTALILAMALPASASAGPIRAAAEEAARQATAAQREVEPRNRTRFWTGIALITGGATLTTLGALEVGDDETGPDDGEDSDDSDDGEDSDGWANKALMGGGVAAAALGGVLLVTGRRKTGPSVSVGRGRVAVRHTIRF
jgi:hypothetical protein